MKATGILRPVDDLGRIVLPVEMRKEWKIKRSDKIEIFVENSFIILKKHSFCCQICEKEIDDKEVTQYLNQDIKICDECKTELTKQWAKKEME